VAEASPEVQREANRDQLGPPGRRDGFGERAPVTADRVAAAAVESGTAASWPITRLQDACRVLVGEALGLPYLAGTGASPRGRGFDRQKLTACRLVCSPNAPELPRSDPEGERSVSGLLSIRCAMLDRTGDVNMAHSGGG
jgi:hypothetical protein